MHVQVYLLILLVTYGVSYILQQIGTNNISMTESTAACDFRSNVYIEALLKPHIASLTFFTLTALL